MASENEIYDSEDTDVPVTEGTNYRVSFPWVSLHSVLG